MQKALNWNIVFGKSTQYTLLSPPPLLLGWNILKQIVCSVKSHTRFSVTIRVTRTCFQLLPPPRRLCFRWGLLIYLFICLWTGLRKQLLMDLDETLWTGGPWANLEPIKFW